MTAEVTPAPANREALVCESIRALALASGNWAVPIVPLMERTGLGLEDVHKAIYELERRGKLSVRRTFGKPAVYTLKGAK